jgi:hypothetical protein
MEEDAMNKEYLDLVNRVRNDYKGASKSNGKIELGWCDDDKILDDNLCREINLWTYWQGWNYAQRESHIHILLIGQDWGNPYSPNEPGTIKNIRMMNSGIDVPYQYLCDKKSVMAQTDVNLISFFDSIGYADIDVIRYPDLFFTNFNLGYRTAQSSGGMTTELMEVDANYIMELIDILKPDKILCLGEAVVKATTKLLFKEIPQYKSFNTYLDEGHIMIYQGKDYTSYIYPLCHPGNYGVKLNRKGGYEQHRKDWARIKENINEN